MINFAHLLVLSSFALAPSPPEARGLGVGRLETRTVAMAAGRKKEDGHSPPPTRSLLLEMAVEGYK